MVVAPLCFAIGKENEGATVNGASLQLLVQKEHSPALHGNSF
jgi:hypothetical protein